MGQPEGPAVRQAEEPVTVRSLAFEYGDQTVRHEAYRVFVNSAVHEIEAVRGAIDSDDFEGYSSLSRESLAALAVISGLSTEDDLKSFLEDTEVAPSDAEVVKNIWDRSREKVRSIQHSLLQILGSFDLEDALSERGLKAIQESVEKKLVNRQSDEELLVIYDHLLQALMVQALDGGSIVDQLGKAVRDAGFRSFLDRLVEAYNASNGSFKPIKGQVQTAAHRYSPVLLAWRDLRIAFAGRQNHWVSMSRNFYSDLDTGYPQLEVRVNTYGGELFYMKDDVDDIMKLAINLFSYCVESVEMYEARHGSIPVDLRDVMTGMISPLMTSVNRARAILEEPERDGV